MNSNTVKYTCNSESDYNRTRCYDVMTPLRDIEGFIMFLTEFFEDQTRATEFANSVFGTTEGYLVSMLSSTTTEVNYIYFENSSMTTAENVFEFIGTIYLGVTDVNHKSEDDFTITKELSNKDIINTVKDLASDSSEAGILLRTLFNVTKIDCKSLCDPIFLEGFYGHSDNYKVVDKDTSIYSLVEDLLNTSFDSFEGEITLETDFYIDGEVTENGTKAFDIFPVEAVTSIDSH